METIPKDKNAIQIKLKSITENDIPFLYSVYRSTRLEELASANFTEKELEDFLQSQFNLQHTQYMKYYKNPSFDIIMFEGNPAGRLYVDRKEDDIRIIDIALLTEYRRKGIGRILFNNLIKESESNKIPLSLHVEHNNPILSFYIGLGFKKGHENGVYYYMTRDISNSSAEK